MNAPGRRAPMLLLELAAGLGSGALGLAFGVLMLREMLGGGRANVADAAVFLACAVLASLAVAVGTWRHVRHGEPAWGRPVAAAALVLITIALFGGPLLLAAALAALAAAALFGINARRAAPSVGRGQVHPGSF